MVSRDYTREVGLPTGDKRVSKPVAVILLLAMGIGAVLAVRTLIAGHHEPAGMTRHASEH